jgi:hypothetical protein
LSFGSGREGKVLGTSRRELRMMQETETPAMPDDPNPGIPADPNQESEGNEQAGTDTPEVPPMDPTQEGNGNNETSPH